MIPLSEAPEDLRVIDMLSRRQYRIRSISAHKTFSSIIFIICHCISTCHNSASDRSWCPFRISFTDAHKLTLHPCLTKACMARLMLNVATAFVLIGHLTWQTASLSPVRISTSLHSTTPFLRSSDKFVIVNEYSENSK